MILARHVGIVVVLALILVVVSVSAKPVITVWSYYHDYERLMNELEKLRMQYPDLVSLASLGTSRQGRTIPLVTLADQTKTHVERAVLFTGAVHGSEVVGTEAIMTFLMTTLEEYMHNATFRELLGSTVIYLIPMLNPDGVEAGKMADDYRLARRNAAGVDLNRNFPWKWKLAGNNSTSSYQYHGPEPLSEPESASLYNFVNSHKLNVILNCHSGEGPYLVYPKESADGALYNAIARTIRALTGYNYIAGGENGSIPTWAYWNSSTHPLSFELEIYNNNAILPSSANWWYHYNPDINELATRVKAVSELLRHLSIQNIPRSRLYTAHNATTLSRTSAPQASEFPNVTTLQLVAFLTAIAVVISVALIARLNARRAKRVGT